MKKIISILLLISILIIPATAYHNQIWVNAEANNAEVYLNEEFIGRIQNQTFEFDYEYDAEQAPYLLRIYHPNCDEWWDYLTQDDYYAEIVLLVLNSERQNGIIKVSTWSKEEGIIEGAEVYVKHSLHWNTSYSYEGLTPLTLILPEGRYYYMVYKEGFEPVKGMNYVIATTPGNEENDVINWDVLLEYGISPRPALIPTQKPFPTPLQPEIIEVVKEVQVPYETKVYIKQGPTLPESIMSGFIWGIFFLAIIITVAYFYLDVFHRINLITIAKSKINSVIHAQKQKIRKDISLTPKYDLLSNKDDGLKGIKFKVIGKVKKYKKKINKIINIIKE